MGNRYLDFWDKVEKCAPDKCWKWIGSVGENGYGKTTLMYKTISAHRLAWIKAKGLIPDGKWVCHSCDNKLCVNPNHLFLGLPKDNTGDMISKGRGGNQKKILCKKGHPLSGDNLFFRLNTRGTKVRRCRICQKASWAKWRQKLSARFSFTSPNVHKL